MTFLSMDFLLQTTAKLIILIWLELLVYIIILSTTVLVIITSIYITDK